MLYTLPKSAAKKRGWDKCSLGFAQQRSRLPHGKALSLNHVPSHYSYFLRLWNSNG